MHTMNLTLSIESTAWALAGCMAAWPDCSCIISDVIDCGGSNKFIILAVGLTHHHNRHEICRICKHISIERFGHFPHILRLPLIRFNPVHINLELPFGSDFIVSRYVIMITRYDGKFDFIAQI